VSELYPLAPAARQTPSKRAKRTLRAKLDLLCERGILGAVVAILVWGPLAYGAVRVNPDSTEKAHLYGLLVIQGLTALAAVLWAVRFFTQKPFRILWPPICWAVLAFLVYAIFRCQQAELAYAAWQNLRCVITYGTLFFVIVNNLNRRESATVVVVALIAVGVGESFFAFFQFMTHYARIWAVMKPAAYALRGSGTYVNPNSFAGFIGMVLPLALAFTAMSRFSATVKVLLGYSALVMMAGVVVSQSRGGLTAVGVTLAVFCVVLIFQPEYWKRGAAALAVLAVAAVILMQQFGSVEDRFTGGLVDKGDSRVFYWTAAENIFHAHLWWGAGPGSFRYLFPTMTGVYGQGTPMNAHNDYLNTLCEWGLAGFAIILAALGFLLAGVIRVWPFVRRNMNDLGSKNSSRAAFVLGASLGVLSILIHSVVDFNMQIPANAVTAITLMALLTGHWRFGTERFWFNPGYVGKFVLAAIVAGTVWFLGREGAQAGREFYWLERGLNARTWDEQLKGLKMAQEIEPRNYMTDYEIGESYRLQAWEGNPGNEDLALKALPWFQRAMELNRYDSESPLGYGFCLDWLDRPKEATKYFVQGLELYRNGARVEWQYAWHCEILGNYSLAQLWLNNSLSVLPSPEAEGYLEMLKKRMAEAVPSTPAGR
jgi:O-antigen ligase